MTGQIAEERESQQLEDLGFIINFKTFCMNFWASSLSFVE